MLVICRMNVVWMLYGQEDDDGIIMNYKEMEIPNIQNLIFGFLRQISYVFNILYESRMKVVWMDV